MPMDDKEGLGRFAAQGSGWGLGVGMHRKDENILVNNGAIYLLYFNSSKVLFFNGINQQYQG